MVLNVYQILDTLSALGVTSSIHVVRRWIRESELKATENDISNRKEGYTVTADELKRFIATRRPELTIQEFVLTSKEKAKVVYRQKQTVTIEELMSQLSQGKMQYLTVERDYIFTDEQKAYVIESLLTRDYEEHMLFAKDFDNFTVVDGSQRLETLYEFINEDRTPFGTSLGTSKFSELPDTIMQEINKKLVSQTILFNHSPGELLELYNAWNDFRLVKN